MATEFERFIKHNEMNLSRHNLSQNARYFKRIKIKELNYFRKKRKEYRDFVDEGVSTETDDDDIADATKNYKIINLYRDTILNDHQS